MTTVPERAPRPDDPEPSEITDRIAIPAQYRSGSGGSAAFPSLPAGHPAAAHPATPSGSSWPAQVPMGRAMTRRNPVAAWLGLPLLTLGVYSYVWYYKIHREMAEFDRRRAVPVAGPLLVVLLLGWTVVAPLVSFFRTGGRIADAQRAAGLRPTCNPWIGLALCFVLGLSVLYYQSELNRVVDAYGAPAGTGVPLRG